MIERLPEQLPTTEFEIEELMYRLEAKGGLFPTLSPDLQIEWRNIESEVENSEDREAAKAHLEIFLDKLDEIEDEGERKIAA
ncbi:MAG: hypothetical protein HYW37_00380 [Candidatus Colwellbacteria bacterium]|nr:hypothetical protein [Candidatus Colwellbacteria bacterium]